MRGLTIATGFIALAGLAGPAPAQDSISVRFPAGYRLWYHNHTSAKPQGPAPDGEAGISNVYANGLALEGLRTGSFKDGAVLVIDRFHIVEDANKLLNQGSRKLILVMERDQARFKDTGGWGWEAFRGGDPGQRLVTDGGKFCFACHRLHADNNLLFTKLRE